MSKLEELIKELCPNGVKFKSLGEITDFRNGKGHEKNISEDGDFIVINSKFISTEGAVYKHSEMQIVPLYKDEIVMVMSDLPNGKALAKCYLIESDSKYTLNQRIGGFKVHETVVFPKFLFYVLNRNYQLLKYDNGVDQTNLRKDDILKIKIPVPPMEVQCEIVRILDNFTELTAELTARKKQYEYYRDELLTFDETMEWKNLLTVSDTFTGLTYRPTDKTNDGTGTLVLRSSNIQNGKLVFDDSVRVSMKKIPERAMIKARDVLICVRNGSKALVGKSVRIPELSEPMAFGAFMSILRPKIDMINADYLFYAWQFVYEQIRRNNDDSMVINQITQKDFASIKIPVPSLEEQERIVSILDRFDKLCNDISVGLPAEIEARKKQYEYYRDKLLTFEPIQSTEKELA